MGVQPFYNFSFQTDNTEDTIKEVERLIQSNPDLPRLTRGEILDILDNLTKQEHGINVEDLYTKPPVTSIIEDDYLPNEQPAVSTSTENVPLFRQKTTKSSDVKKPYTISKRKPSRGTFDSGKSRTFMFSSSTSPPSKEQTPEATTERVTTPRFSTTTRRDIKRRRRPVVTTTSTTQMPVTTYRPRRRQPLRKEVQYSNHQYPEDHSKRPTYPPEGIRIIKPPVLVQAATEINSELEDLLPQEMENSESFIPMPVKNDDSEIKYHSEPSIELEIPEHLKKVVADLNLATPTDPHTVSLTSVAPQSEKSEADRVKDILASIGVYPTSSTNTPSTSTTTNSPNGYAVVDNLSPDMQELLKNFGLLPDPNENVKQNEIPEFNPETAKIDPKSYMGFKPLPADTGSRREMEELLSQFGLLDKNTRSSKSLKKEIPRSNEIADASSNSSNPNIQIEQISIDAVPDDLKPILQNMGFGSTRGGRKVREQPATETLSKSVDDENIPKSSKNHQEFGPIRIMPNGEVQKLGRLLEIMRKLEKLNGSITEDDMDQTDKREFKELISSLKPQNPEDLILLHDQKAPNPVEDDRGLSKNDIKRAEDEVTEQVVTVTSESLPEETKTASIKDLEDSFGGSTDTATETLPETTTPRRSGFYYLMDWNSFFEIDDQKGKRVNLRFQPKVGDPKRFFSVNIP
ncbi:hypothetical protein HUJ04_010586 [Dendroctonus ponderosae]|nr:hypothetical protein HUJ04_010586 [Dendroctonus ponderosae]